MIKFVHINLVMIAVLGYCIAMPPHGPLDIVLTALLIINILIVDRQIR